MGTMINLKRRGKNVLTNHIIFGTQKPKLCIYFKILMSLKIANPCRARINGVVAT